MKLEEQVCSLELAKRLKELGVKQESQFYWGEGTLGAELVQEWNRLRVQEDIAAFTVAELGQIMPKNIEGRCWKMLADDNKPWWIGYTRDISAEADTEANARAKMLIYLIENKLIPLT